MNGIYSCDGAPLQGAYITPYMVSVGAPAAYPRLLKGDGFTVLPRMTTTPKRNPTATRPQRGHPLNSRGSERPADSKRKEKRTPAGCPTTQMGDPSRVDIPSTILPGVLRTPRLLKGGRFHRPDADNHDAQTQPDRNADNLSIAVGRNDLRTASAKEKRTPAGCPNS